MTVVVAVVSGPERGLARAGLGRPGVLAASRSWGCCRAPAVAASASVAGRHGPVRGTAPQRGSAAFAAAAARAGRAPRGVQPRRAGGRGADGTAGRGAGRGRGRLPAPGDQGGSQGDAHRLVPGRRRRDQVRRRQGDRGQLLRQPVLRRRPAGATAAGLPVLGYAFANPKSGNGTAAGQAEYLVSHAGTVGGRTPPLMLDIEYNPYQGGECYGLSKAAMVSWLKSFDAEARKLTGQVPVLYTTGTGGTGARATARPSAAACCGWPPTPPPPVRRCRRAGATGRCGSTPAPRPCRASTRLVTPTWTP